MVLAQGQGQDGGSRVVVWAFVVELGVEDGC